MKKSLTKLKWLAILLASLGVAASTSSAFAETKVDSRGGLRVYNPDNCDYWFTLGGRLDFDETIFSGHYYDKQYDFPNGANLRRAFLKFMGGVGDCFTYNFTLSVRSATVDLYNFYASSADFEDAWLNWAGLYNTNLRVGQFTPLATIDDWGNWGTVNDTIFLESSLPTIAFSVPDKALGLWVDTNFADMFTVAATAYQPRQNNTFIPNGIDSPNNYWNASRSDRVGTALRVTFVPIHTETCVFHLGALGRFQAMNNHKAGFQVFQPNLFYTRPEALARHTSALVNTGAFLRAKSYNTVAGEILGIWGPFLAEAEYTHANVQRIPRLPSVFFPTQFDVGNVSFHGWHIQAAYMLTGESRGYDFATGTIQNPCPNSPCGAWEIAIRHSYIDLNNKNVFGGSEHNTTIGLNWFINDNVRLAANYINAHIHPGTLTGIVPATAVAERRLDIFGVRLGVEF